VTRRKTYALLVSTVCRNLNWEPSNKKTKNKMIPAVLPDNIRAPSLGQDYPKYLCPEETVCHRCPGVVPLSDPILITKRAKILSNWCIVEGRML